MTTVQPCPVSPKMETIYGLALYFKAVGIWPINGRQALPMLGPLVIYIAPPWAQMGLELTTSR